MPGYTCFWHPQENRANVTLDSTCPDCGKRYDHTLNHRPQFVGDYVVEHALDRGFYSTAYVARDTKLDRQVVLKVVPKRMYEVFPHDFAAECRRHAKVAAKASHVVGLYTFFDAPVSFADEALECHVAVLEYVKGKPLAKYLSETTHPAPETLAQITIDLFSLLAELQSTMTRHNDLHEGNILVQSDGEDINRPEAIDRHLKVVAIDLGSVSEESKSTEERYGDLHRVCEHLSRLAERAISDPQGADPTEYRVSLEIRRIVQLHLPESNAQRQIPPAECVQLIYRAWHGGAHPWRDEFLLERLSDTYNAQTLPGWAVPHLLVDPYHWTEKISSPGPVILTGMRGCGKTILLKSLEAHSRLSTETTKKNPLGRHKADTFLGLFVSCTRLLSKPGVQTTVHEPFAKLLVAYALEAVRLLDHLEFRKQGSTNPKARDLIWEAVTQCVSQSSTSPESERNHSVEHSLERLLIQLQREETGVRCTMNPALAMEVLAKAIKRCSIMWETRRLYFLLDDASTRFLPLDAVKDIVFSRLIAYQSGHYSFKVTTEEQTFQAVLSSLADIEHARAGRDYDWFDLGQHVLESLKGDAGKSFVIDILKARISRLKVKPSVLDPKVLLGDMPLEELAREIVAATANSPSLKGAYWGLSALVGLCVGDIGDIVTLYERILDNAKGQTAPVPREIQSNCFQDMSSNRLFDLNRRKTDLRDHALAFADASHKLMRASVAKIKKGSKRGNRLRQYSSVYVRITGGNAAEQATQFDKILELIDAGVFVFAGGPSGPRTKTRDQDPTKQFKLAFRKVFGLSSYIGLGDSDRFELSGKRLADWLKSPTAELLMSGEGAAEIPSSPGSKAEKVSVRGSNSKPVAAPRKLFDDRIDIPDTSAVSRSIVMDEPISKSATSIEAITSEVNCDCVELADLSDAPPQSVLTSTGFEERAVGSFRLVLKNVAAEIVLLQYDDSGRQAEMLAAANAAGRGVKLVSAKDLTLAVNSAKAPILLDITTLAKPLLFQLLVRILKRDGHCYVLYTHAQTNAPTEEDIQNALKRAQDANAFALLDIIGKVSGGELGPYGAEALLNTPENPTQRRVLVGFASARPNRLMSFLDSREYDKIVVVVASNDATPGRRKVIDAAGDVIASTYGAEIVPLRSAGVASTYQFLMTLYKEWYMNRAHEVEVALTGSKLQSVGVALASMVTRLSQVWYVRPAKVEKERYSKGHAQSQVYHISVKKR